eukprot:1882040-Ditylum_brightwellii.AAC.1
MKDVTFEQDNKENQQTGEEVLQELTEFVQQHYPDTQEEQFYIPKIRLNYTIRKLGNGPGKIEAPVIVIESTAQDTPYLKTLLTYGYKTGQITLGRFVPSGIYLSTDVNMYKSLLQKKNAYIELRAAVVINGLIEEAAHSYVTYHGKKVKLSKLILGEEYYDFEQLERTSKTERQENGF